MLVAGPGRLDARARAGGERSFGDLDPREILRLIIPSTLFIALGFQIILSSFFLSVLGLGIRDEESR